MGESWKGNARDVRAHFFFRLSCTKILICMYVCIYIHRRLRVSNAPIMLMIGACKYVLRASIS